MEFGLAKLYAEIDARSSERGWYLDNVHAFVIRPEIKDRYADAFEKFYITCLDDGRNVYSHGDCATAKLRFQWAAETRFLPDTSEAQRLFEQTKNECP